MSTRKFCVTDDDQNFEAFVMIKQEPAVLETVKQMVEFWGGYEERLEDNDNDYCKALVQQVGERLLALSLEYSGAYAVKFLGNQEGYASLDGMSGITVQVTSAYKLPDVSVKEVKI